jgi:hypothetical protein
MNNELYNLVSSSFFTQMVFRDSVFGVRVFGLKSQLKMIYKVHTG